MPNSAQIETNSSKTFVIKKKENSNKKLLERKAITETEIRS